MNNFLLLGHDCTYGQYPAPVLAVGQLDGMGLVAIYPGGKDSATPEPIDEKAAYVRHSEALRSRLAGFDWISERLFAYGEQDVTAYGTHEETSFFAHFLRSHSSGDPFVRFMLAEQTRDAQLIVSEIDACYQRLRVTAPASAESWRQEQMSRWVATAAATC